MDLSIARDQILRALYQIAPELESLPLENDAPIRQRYDLDSADFLNFIQVIFENVGISIPERDYPHLTTIAGASTYLAKALDKKGTSADQSSIPKTT